ncbi:MAG: DUF4861 domain-containing protein [Chitinophagaceae bacterium]|nr:DUF4861 domain-containing protein [Chitinophagaceae bacterium]
MKKLVLIIGVMASLQLSAQKATLSLKNSLNQIRTDELIVLTRSQVEKKLGTLNANQYVAIINSNSPVATQFDDLNKDGVWDEVCFLQNLGAQQKLELDLKVVNEKPADAIETRAHVRHKRKNADDSFGADLSVDSIPAGQVGADFNKVKLPPFLTEGPAWENDKVGFRLYFDVRNGKDIWGKTTTNMVLDEVGVDPLKNYHERSDWGMDVLKAGSSLGAGALALKLKVNGKDSLIRLGGVNMGKVIYEKISDGPVLAKFRLYYPEWKILNGAHVVAVTEEISIWGGQYFYDSKVTISGAPANASLIVGIVNLKSKQLHQQNSPGAKFIYTYDEQSENHDKMGMAILLPKSEKYKAGTAPNTNSDIRHTYYVAMSIKGNAVNHYRFVAGWEQSESIFKTEQGFDNYIRNQSSLYLNPVIVN